MCTENPPRPPCATSRDRRCPRRFQRAWFGTTSRSTNFLNDWRKRSCSSLKMVRSTGLSWLSRDRSLFGADSERGRFFPQEDRRLRRSCSRGGPRMFWRKSQAPRERRGAVGRARGREHRRQGARYHRPLAAHGGRERLRRGRHRGGRNPGAVRELGEQDRSWARRAAATPSPTARRGRGAPRLGRPAALFRRAPAGRERVRPKELPRLPRSASRLCPVRHRSAHRGRGGRRRCRQTARAAGRCRRHERDRGDQGAGVAHRRPRQQRHCPPQRPPDGSARAPAGARGRALGRARGSAGEPRARPR